MCGELSWRHMTLWSTFRNVEANRSYTGESGCRLCGTFLDSQVEHGETCGIAEATRGHYPNVYTRCSEASKLADLGVTTEEVSQKQHPGQLIFFTSRCCPWTRRALDVCVASSNATAALEDAAQAAFDRKLSHYRHQIRDLRGQGSSTALWSERMMGGHTQRSHEPCNMQQTSHYAAIAPRT